MNRIILILSCCFASLTLAQEQDIADVDAPEETEDQISQISAERKAMDLLVKFQNPQTVVWLNADSEDFLGLYQPALKGTANGSILMLHAEGQHPDWPGPLAHLRKRFAAWGWNTLAISLPAPDPPKPPAVPAASMAEPASGEVLDETEEVFDPETNSLSDGSVVPEGESKTEDTNNRAEEIAVERIVAAVAYLTNEGNTTVVLYGQGIGALRASRYWQETADSNIAALVFIDARNGLPNSEFTLPQTLTNPKMPILDVVQARSIEVEIDAKQRAEQAAINDLEAFQQQLSTESPEVLGTFIDGFLRRHSK